VRWVVLGFSEEEDRGKWLGLSGLWEVAVVMEVEE
jgi:hypothetical protein